MGWSQNRLGCTSVYFQVTFFLLFYFVLGSLRSYNGNVTWKLNFALSLLRLFHVGRVVQNKRIALSLAWHEWFSCKGREWKIYCCELALSLEHEIFTRKNFTSSFGRRHQNIEPKSVPHVQHDYFSSFNQSKHWLVALSLTWPSSNLN